MEHSSRFFGILKPDSVQIEANRFLYFTMGLLVHDEPDYYENAQSIIQDLYTADALRQEQILNRIIGQTEEYFDLNFSNPKVNDLLSFRESFYNRLPNWITTFSYLSRKDISLLSKKTSISFSVLAFLQVQAMTKIEKPAAELIFSFLNEFASFLPDYQNDLILDFYNEKINGFNYKQNMKNTLILTNI